MFHHAAQLLRPGDHADADAAGVLEAVGFADPVTARRRLQSLCGGSGSGPDACRTSLAKCLPMLLAALSDAATPDGSLLNFERYVQSVDQRAALFDYLGANPRAVEILVRLFVGSQFLTEILIRNPDYLERLTLHKRLAEYKHREQFFFEACGAASGAGDLPQQFDALRRYQKWELLRIGACDGFGLLDLRNVTVQLSLLADSLVRACLAILCTHLRLSPDKFCVLAFGKLGGEELNYSSDIDLVFLADGDATRFWELGQKLIKALIDATGEGFLYRVDMRLRPWGKSGALVNTVEGHLAYLKKHGMAWEKQALLKARVIAGDEAVGAEFLQRAEPLIYSLPPEQVRESVRATKLRIEAELGRKGRTWGEVKGGPGSIRDVEFTVQCLQLIYGGEDPSLRTFNTLDGLVRLAESGHIQADEYRQLSGGYNFLRTVEHALQLMHHKQVHSLPGDRRELAYLARRLDYPDGDRLAAHYEDTVQTVRSIFEKYVGERRSAPPPENAAAAAHHLARMEPSYHDSCSAADVAAHAALLARVNDQNPVEIQTEPLADGRWRLTVAGRDHVGDLSIICGLLFEFGFDIEDGNVFTELRSGTARQLQSAAEPSRGGEFVNIFTVRPTRPTGEGVWKQYHEDLKTLMGLVLSGHQREAQGQLVNRVAAMLRSKGVRIPPAAVDSSGQASITFNGGPVEPLLPVQVTIDNEANSLLTVLHIRGADTPGFLFELANALAVTGYDVNRVIISTVGSRVFDTLYVSDRTGGKVIGADAQQELRTAVVLIKHFTRLLSRSPDPERALLHFRDFLDHLFHQPDWVEAVASLERSDVLDALATVLGVSDFLWEDFLRLQYANLFPVVTNLALLVARKPRSQLDAEVAVAVEAASDSAARRSRLNAFKDREMFRVDMRHILGRIPEFGQFSDELSDVADAVIAATLTLCAQELQRRYGLPQSLSGTSAPPAICALGKCGGRELGYASDIELMFIYAGDGRTSGPESIRNSEYCQRVAELFTGVIEARQEGIFQVDLRLRPYGRAGSLAVAMHAFESYFKPTGPAWPYERQALVKLRPVAGDSELGAALVQLRDRLIYTGEPFDIVAMRAMREKQVRQLVQPGTFNAKLSPGGLVDTEYLVQGLQITHGAADPTLRPSNTLAAMAALAAAGLLGHEYDRLRDAYIFQRRLIDALRMVRGHAKDLTVPPAAGAEFEFLARRLAGETTDLAADLERHTATVLECARLLPTTDG